MYQLTIVYIFCGLIGVAVIFQWAIALGAPWGHLTMGGKFSGQLPLAMRIAALVQSIILIVLALIVLVRTNILFESFYAISEKAIWGVAIFNTIGSVLNIITPSKWERILWAPIIITLTLCSYYIALS